MQKSRNYKNFLLDVKITLHILNRLFLVFRDQRLYNVSRINADTNVITNVTYTYQELGGISFLFSFVIHNSWPGNVIPVSHVIMLTFQTLSCFAVNGKLSPVLSILLIPFFWLWLQIYQEKYCPLFQVIKHLNSKD